jgi:Flp pilus assembly protein TadG
MKFWNDKGNIAVMAALCMPMIIGGAGLGVETGYWYYEQLKLQQAADAAAYAAALEQRAGAGVEEAEAKAEAAAEANGFDDTRDTIDMVTPSTMETDETNSVDVELTRTLSRAFTALFSEDLIHIRARATAAYSTAANACVLALDKSASPAITFSGNSSATMEGCVVMSNSMGSGSILFDGNSDVTAPCIMTVGGYTEKSNAEYELTQCGAVSTGQPPAADPYKEIDYPTACSTAGCAKTVSGPTLSEGTYNGLNINANSTVHFNAGVYIINGGTFKINANANVTGEDVTFVLLNGASVDFNGNAEIQLDAPTTGDYKGMLFMGSRTSTAGGMSNFNGNANSRLTGALYFPKEDITYNGNFSGNGGCTQIVANKIVWNGNTKFNVDCSAAGLEPITAGSAVRLIG